MTIHLPATQTPAQWNAAADDLIRRTREMASDTEGFISPIPQGVDSIASIYRTCAKVAANDSQWNFVEPCDAETGEPFNARYVNTQYGGSWVWDDENGNTTWFRESTAKSGKRRMAAHAKKGVRMCVVRRPAIVSDASWLGGAIIPDRYTTEYTVVASCLEVDSEGL